MISTKNKWLFIHPPKTAGTSLAQALLPYSDDAKRRVPGQRSSDNFELSGPLTYSKHQNLRSYQIMVGGVLDDFLLIGGTRHPLQRMLSLYFYPGNWVRERIPGGRRLSATKLHVFNPFLVRREEPVWDEARFIRLLAETAPLSDFYRRSTGDIRLPDIRVEANSVNDAATRVAESLNLTSFQVGHLNKSLRPDKVIELSRSVELANLVYQSHAEDYAVFSYDLLPNH